MRSFSSGISITYHLSLLLRNREPRAFGLCCGVMGILFPSRQSVRRCASQRGRLADAILLYDRQTARDLVQRHRFNAKRTYVAVNTIDQTPIQSARRLWEGTSKLEDFQRTHGIANRPVFLHVSRLQPRRDIETLLRAFAILREGHPNAVAVVLGEGDAEKCRLLRLANALGIVENIQFVHGSYSESEITPSGFFHRWQLAIQALLAWERCTRLPMDSL